jgi:uncharacterized Tic20 family protein
MNADCDRPTRWSAALCALTTFPTTWIFGLIVTLFGVTIFQAMDFNEFYGLTGVTLNIGGAWVIIVGLAGINYWIGMWLAKQYWRAMRGRHPLVQHHAEAAQKFQRRWGRYALISMLLWTLLLVTVCGVGPTQIDEVYGVAIAAFLWLAALGVFNGVIMIFAAVQALRGQIYHYPGATAVLQ